MHSIKTKITVMTVSVIVTAMIISTVLGMWKDTDQRDLTVSVNVSAKDFYNMDVVRVLTELTDKYGVDRRKLRLEITETALHR
jgi:EAL domain-containing protein (putative c-di-GMP-specific phosphodiesterase class I)